MYRTLLFLLLITCGFSSCMMYVSSCQPSKSNVVSYAVEVNRDEGDIVQSIVVYYGYSLINTCWSYQDFYIGHIFTVNDTYPISTDIYESIISNYSSFFFIRNAEYIRSKRVRCGQILQEGRMYDLASLNCTYRNQPIYPMDNHDYIGDTLQFRLMDKGIYLFKENVTLTQKCDRCDECDITTGISSFVQFLICFVIMVVAIIVFVLFIAMIHKINDAIHKKRM